MMICTSWLRRPSPTPYFRKEGGGREGVHVEFKDVERLDASFGRTEFMAAINLSTEPKHIGCHMGRIVVTGDALGAEKLDRSR